MTDTAGSTPTNDEIPAPAAACGDAARGEMTTTAIAVRQRRFGIHPCDPGAGGWVSTRSMWTSMVWKMDSATPRMRNSDCTIIWDEEVPTSITEALKTLAWSMLVKRSTGKPLALSNFARLGHKLRYLAYWMMRRGYRHLGEITTVAVRTYRKDLIEQLSTDEKGASRDIDVDTNTVAGYLLLLQYAYEQADQLRARGVAPLGIPPFAASSAWVVAEGIVTDVEGFTPPLPDEVALPIANTAHLWLGVPADDVMRLQAICFEERRVGRSDVAISRSIRNRLETFEFGSIEEGGPAWHPPFRDLLRAYSERPAPSSEDEEGAPVALYGLDLVARLIDNLVAACSIVVRYQSGVRHGELFSFAPGIGVDGRPSCVTSERSLSGAYEMFFVHGLVEKGWDHPTETKWLLAARISSDTVVPDAVKALEILSRIGEPWREWATDADAKKALLLRIGFKGLPRKRSGVAPLSSEALAESMRRFIVGRVDLSHLDASDERLRRYAETRGAAVQSKQWRKTWANWVYRVDKRLLPAISQQFHHQSVVVTEEAYVGKDAVQLGLVESGAMTRAVAWMRRAMEGEAHVGGGMRKSSAAALSKLDRSMAGLSGAEKDDGIRTWLVERDVRMWFAPHGKCFIGLMPSDARCREAGGTVDWLATTPDYAHRTPRLCSGCPAFAVDEDDLPFWTKRYLENRTIWDDAVSRRVEHLYVVADERWRQSMAILTSLGVDIATVDREAGIASGR